MGGEDLPDPAPDQARPTALTETTMVEHPDLDEPMKRYPLRDPVVIPYMKGVCEQVRRVMKGHGLKVYCKPTNMFSQTLVLLNDRVVKGDQRECGLSGVLHVL